jgi:alkylated DNA repair dioxygenase AlkB
MVQSLLFADAPVLPDGLVYEPEFLAPADEASLQDALRALPVAESRYRGYVAKRRTASFGCGYDFTANRLEPAPPLPAILEPVRARVAAWSGIPVARFVQGLVTEYRPGAPIGWHRDVPPFESVVGISLGGACRLRFRPYPPAKDWMRHAFTLDLAPRSAYRMQREIRWRWQHAIPEVREARWSITFRTLAPDAGAFERGAPRGGR